MKLLWLITLLAGVSQGFAEGVPARGAKLEKLADGFIFTEGPTCDANGNIFSPTSRTTAFSSGARAAGFPLFSSPPDA